MHFEKLTKGTPHEPMSPMNSKPCPPWLINHQSNEPIFETLPIDFSLLLKYCLIILFFSFYRFPFLIDLMLDLQISDPSKKLHLHCYSWSHPQDRTDSVHADSVAHQWWGWPAHSCRSQTSCSSSSSPYTSPPMPAACPAQWCTQWGPWLNWSPGDEIHTLLLLMQKAAWFSHEFQSDSHASLMELLILTSSWGMPHPKSHVSPCCTGLLTNLIMLPSFEFLTFNDN